MNRVTKHDIDALFEQQLCDWRLAHDNYAASGTVRTKELWVGRTMFKVQFNPTRIKSSAAKVDEKSIKERKCFLCDPNRPAEQKSLLWGNDYRILINPYPIFLRHLTIASRTHTPQHIAGRINDMMLLAADLDDFILFYNGPKCGASAPDHFHFQAGNKGFLPVECELHDCLMREIVNKDDAAIYLAKNEAYSFFVIFARSIRSGENMFSYLYHSLPVANTDYEPMLNILCWTENNEWRIVVFPRAKHRPDCYYLQNDSNMLISPASVDMGGVFITPLEKDFYKITAQDIKSILGEVCLQEDSIKSAVIQIKKAIQS